MIRRRSSRTVPLLALALMVAGPTVEADTTATTTTTAATTIVRVAGLINEGSPGEVLWRRFRANLEAAGIDGLDVRMLIRGEVGSEEGQLSAIRRGRVQVAGISAGGLAAAVPEYAVLTAPFLFDTVAEADFVHDRFLQDAFRDLAARRGLVHLAWIDIGWINVYGRKPVLAPDDMRGYRMRAQQSRSSQLFLTMLGADVIQLTFPDVVPALQTGLVSGGEASTLMYAETGVADAAGHYTLTHHAYNVAAVVVDKVWFDRQSPALRQALAAAAPPPAYSRRLMRTLLADKLAAAQARGVQVHVLDAAQRDRWKAAARPVTDRLIAAIGGRAPELMALIQSGKRAYRHAERSGRRIATQP